MNLEIWCICLMSMVLAVLWWLKDLMAEMVGAMERLSQGVKNLPSYRDNKDSFVKLIEENKRLQHQLKCATAKGKLQDDNENTFTDDERWISHVTAKVHSRAGAYFGFLLVLLLASPAQAQQSEAGWIPSAGYTDYGDGYSSSYVIPYKPGVSSSTDIRMVRSTPTIPATSTTPPVYSKYPDYKEEYRQVSLREIVERQQVIDSLIKQQSEDIQILLKAVGGQ